MIKWLRSMFGKPVVCYLADLCTVQGCPHGRPHKLMRLGAHKKWCDEVVNDCGFGRKGARCKTVRGLNAVREEVK